MFLNILNNTDYTTHYDTDYKVFTVTLMILVYTMLFHVVQILDDDE